MKQVKQAYVPGYQQGEVVVLMQANPAYSSWLLFIFSLFSMAFTYLTYRQSQTKQAALPALQPSKLDTQTQVRLHNVLDTYFNEQELRELCFDLGIDYEDLPFSGQSHKARELVAVCARNGRLHTLRQEIHKKRPQLLPDMPLLSVQHTQARALAA